MARKPMVTRTFTTYVYECIAMDLNTMSVSNVLVELARIPEKKEKLELELKTNLEEKGLKYVAFTSEKTRDRLLGMTEQDFLKYAVELDQDTRRPIGEEPSNEEETEE